MRNQMAGSAEDQKKVLKKGSTTVGGLRRFNAVMALFHLAQGVILLSLSSDFSLPVMSYFLEMDTVTNKLNPIPEVLFNLRLAPLIAGFLIVTAIAHATVSSPWVFQWYSRNLGTGANYARWMEYSLSSSVMLVVIAMLVGIYDVASLILMFSLNATMILFGWLMELHNQTEKDVNWTSFWFGTFAGLMPWVVIGIYLFGAGNGDGGPPGFVYGIFGSIFVFFNVFAINMVFQYKKIGPWHDYLFGERVYILLSLSSKSVLAWQVFAGTLRPV